METTKPKPYTYAKRLGASTTHILGDDGRPRCGVVNKSKNMQVGEWRTFTAAQSTDQHDFDSICNGCLRDCRKNNKPAAIAMSQHARTESVANQLVNHSRRFGGAAPVNRDWRTERITERQQDCLIALGVRDPLIDTWTRGKAAAEIARLTQEKPAECS